MDSWKLIIDNFGIMNETEHGKNDIQNGKITAITSYILIVGILIALSMNAESKNKFASFHIKQALGLNLTFISIGLLISNFSNTQIYVSFWVFFTVLLNIRIFEFDRS